MQRVDWALSKGHLLPQWRAAEAPGALGVTWVPSQPWQGIKMGFLVKGFCSE